MKKLVFLSLSLCLFTFVASAQKIKDADIQGTWKLIALDAGGLKLDLVKTEVTASKEVEAKVTPEQLKQGKEGMLAAAESLKGSTMKFEKGTMTQAMGGQEQSGTYTLTEKEGKQVVEVKSPDSAQSEVFFVSMQNKQLTLKQVEANGQYVDLIYTK